MRSYRFAAVSLFLCTPSILHANEAAGGKGWLRLLPENPHYFEFEGKPAVLVTSGEHYGAVLNLEFEFIPYLDELKSRGFNLTRTFSGVYREVPGNFKIRGNTLAPVPGRYISPWPRSAQPGESDGGARFDLARWNDEYFKRLRAFVDAAAERKIIVELVLFCPFYEESMWKASPMNSANNLSGLGAIPREEVYTLKHPEMVDLHRAVVRKIVEELKERGNLYYEICNEPYFGGVTIEWQRRIADEIAAAEAGFPRRHLIAQNIANGSARIENPHPAVSIFNFHYGSPPDAVAANRALQKPIAFDESGFRGSSDDPYRTEAWEFLLAGGASYSNLDYSFTAASPSGGAAVDAPGGGGPALRGELSFLKRFLENLKFWKLSPDPAALVGGAPAGFFARLLAEKGKAYAIYLHRQPRGKADPKSPPPAETRVELRLDLPAGDYRAVWFSPISGKAEKEETFRHAGGERIVASPAFLVDVALTVTISS